MSFVLILEPLILALLRVLNLIDSQCMAIQDLIIIRISIGTEAKGIVPHQDRPTPLAVHIRHLVQQQCLTLMLLDPLNGTRAHIVEGFHRHRYLAFLIHLLLLVESLSVGQILQLR